MAKIGEINYLRNHAREVGEKAIVHAVNKPFSDPDCARLMAQVATVLSLLPRCPARLLDLGCGTGWTSITFARVGYDVVGVDIAPDMIYHAPQNQERAGLANVRFVESDYESLPFHEEFDGAVFFDALHHAVDEELAMRMAYQALKPGGVCVTSEPAEGHHQSADAIRAVEHYGVTEKEMPPSRVTELGRKAGFRSWEVYASPWSLHQLSRDGWWCKDLAAPRRVEGGPGKRLFHWLLRRRIGMDAAQYATMIAELPRLLGLLRLFAQHRDGIVVLTK